MSSIFRFASALALVVFVLSAAHAQSLVPDPDFDIDTSHWNVENGTLSLDSSTGAPDSPSAKAVLELLGTDYWFSAYSDCIPVSSSNDTYELSVYYMVLPTGEQDAVNANLATFAGANCTGAELQIALGNSVAISDGWYKTAAGSLTLPAGTDSIAVVVIAGIPQSSAGGVTPIVHFDHVLLGPSGTTPVTLQSFSVK